METETVSGIKSDMVTKMSPVPEFIADPIASKPLEIVVGKAVDSILIKLADKLVNKFEEMKAEGKDTDAMFAEANEQAKSLQELIDAANV
jgi:hypothetical protein